MKLEKSIIFGYNMTILKVRGWLTAWRLGWLAPNFFTERESIKKSIESDFSDRIYAIVNTVNCEQGGMKMLNSQELMFLKMVHDPELRKVLLVRLEKLGLLSAFLEKENETK